MEVYALLVVCALSLIQQSAGADCQFQIPATYQKDACETYDLTKIATAGPFIVNATDYFDHNSTYYFSFCANFDKSLLPAACASLGEAPAYQYVLYKNACHRLGSIEDAIALPVDPMDSSSGIRVAYTGGDRTESGYFNFVVLHSFYCDLQGTQPRVVYEYPENTVKVLWPWPAGVKCSLGTSPGTCPRFHYDGTFNTTRLRPRPRWFDEAKFGIFLHWGVFSVPSFGDQQGAEWYWHMLETGNADVVEFHNQVYGCSGVDPDKFPCSGPKFSYYDFRPMFRAEFFSPAHWANLFSKAGAKYVVLTSKHHEGWCNFPSSQHWNWNSADLGPHRDLVGDLTNSVVKAGLVMGLYHSLREWYNPLYLKDAADNCSTTDFPDKICNPTMMDMINAYKPMLLWNDGDGDAPCQHTTQYWDAPKFRSWVYNESPVRDSIVINNRCGLGCVGDYITGSDRYTPGHLVNNKWESAFTIQAHSWGYDRRDSDPYITSDKLIYQLVETVACNGNLLLNVGPTADGRIDPIFEERLLDIGAWLEVNGEAIYSSFPWRVQFDSSDKETWYTSSKDGQFTYAITFSSLTPGGKLALTAPITSPATTVELLGYTAPLSWVASSPSGLTIYIPTDVDRQLLGDKPAWTFRMRNVA